MLCEHGGRSVRIRALPIGIPYEHFETLARNAPPNSISTENIKIILGVDRLDYTKGKIKKTIILFVCFVLKLRKQRTGVAEVTKQCSKIDMKTYKFFLCFIKSPAPYNNYLKFKTF